MSDSICECGLARSYHPRKDDPKHVYKPRYPTGSKYGLPRPYGSLSSRELEAELATQLKRPMEAEPLEVTAYGDASRSWLLPDRAYGASHAVTSNASTATGDIIVSTNTFDMGGGVKYTLEQSYLHKPDGSIKAVGPSKVREGVDSVGREDDLTWLRRRVAEILWVPA